MSILIVKLQPVSKLKGNHENSSQRLFHVLLLGKFWIQVLHRPEDSGTISVMSWSRLATKTSSYHTSHHITILVHILYEYSEYVRVLYCNQALSIADSFNFLHILHIQTCWNHSRLGVEDLSRIDHRFRLLNRSPNKLLALWWYLIMASNIKHGFVRIKFTQKNERHPSSWDFLGFLRCYLDSLEFLAVRFSS